jgi:hypothetical protein
LSAEEDRQQVAAPPETRREIEGLVLRFTRNLDVYTRPQYKETQARVEFIDPFFEAFSIPAGKKLYQRQIEATDEEIDALVYELYGLTEEEITILEGQE